MARKKSKYEIEMEVKSRLNDVISRVTMGHLNSKSFKDLNLDTRDSSLVAEMDKLMINKELVAVLQCGGIGERFLNPQIKPLYDSKYIHKNCFANDTFLKQEAFIEVRNPYGDKYWDEMIRFWVVERPISNLFRDLPKEMMILPHINQYDEMPFREFLQGFGGYGHPFDFLKQQEGPLRLLDGNQLYYPCNKKIIMAALGAGTFGNSFKVHKIFKKKIPKYCLVIDGSKMGIAMSDVVGAFDKLRQAQRSCVVMTVPEEFINRSKERDYLINGIHPRRAYLNEEKQEVQEYPGKVTGEAINHWEASAGVYIFKLADYIECIQGREGPLAKVRSTIRAIHEGYTNYFKPTMALDGYTNQSGERISGISFTTYRQNHYIFSLKVPDDMEKYFKSIEEGKLDYRWWYK